MLHMVYHPLIFCLSVNVAIHKNKKTKKSDSINYRAITISSLLGKIFDNSIF